MTSDTTDRVLAFIRSFLDTHPFGPTRFEIAVGCRLSSQTVADYHVRKLARSGEIELTQDTSRNIRLKEGK